MLEGYMKGLDVPLEEFGQVVINNSSQDHWMVVRGCDSIKPVGRFYFSMIIECLLPSSNS